MTSANSTDLLYYKDAAYPAGWGAEPAANPKFKLLRFTNDGLIHEQDTEISEEIESDNQIADSIRTSIRASGPVGLEWSASTYDEFMESLLYADAAFGAPATVISANTTVSTTAPSTISLGTGSWTTTPTVGQWIYVAGFTDANNNGFFKVAAATTTSITVAGSRLTTEAAGDTVTITQLASIVNGSTIGSYYLERHNKDLTAAGDRVTSFLGMSPTQFQLSIPTAGKVTGSFTFVGKKEKHQTATKGDGSPTAKTTTAIMSSIDNVVLVMDNHTPLEVVSVELTINNGLESRGAVGTLGAHSLRKGSIICEGTIQAYLADRVRLLKMLNQTASSFAICFLDADAKGYVFEFPKTKFTSGEATTPGRNQDVYESIGFRAFKHGTELKSIRIARKV